MLAWLHNLRAFSYSENASRHKSGGLTRILFLQSVVSLDKILGNLNGIQCRALLNLVA